MRTSRAGVTFVETLMAALLLAVSIIGLTGLWNVCYIRIQHTGETNQAGELARAEIERAKVLGPANFPVGDYNSASQTAIWRGVYDPTAPNTTASGYVKNGFAYYDIQGNQVASNAVAAKYKLQVQVVDTDVLLVSTGGYTFDYHSERALVATVWQLPSNAVLFQSGTNMVVGGF